MDAFEITQMLTDEYSAKILVGTFRVPKSAIQLSREYGNTYSSLLSKNKEP